MKELGEAAIRVAISIVAVLLIAVILKVLCKAISWEPDQNLLLGVIAVAVVSAGFRPKQ